MNGTYAGEAGARETGERFRDEEMSGGDPLVSEAPPAVSGDRGAREGADHARHAVSSPATENLKAVLDAMARLRPLSARWGMATEGLRA